MSPATSREMTLHQRLLDRDDIASAEAFECYLDKLARYLIARHPEIAAYDSKLIEEAVSEALFSYISYPEKYDPRKKSLLGYLYMSAEGDLLNLWRKVPEQEKSGRVTSLDEIVELEFTSENSFLSYLETFDTEADAVQTLHQAWQVLLTQVSGVNSVKLVQILDELVALPVRDGKSIMEPIDRYEDQSTGTMLIRCFWRQVQALVPDETERQVLVLMLCGVRETSIYAEALALTDWPVDEQAGEVKRVKDRLKRRLQRTDWSEFVQEVR